MPYVQLYRPFPVPHTPAPKLHHAGYRATPDRVAPLCSDGCGPYGRMVWCAVGRTLPLPLCGDCAAAWIRRRTASGHERPLAPTEPGSDAIGIVADLGTDDAT
jgi:hypothetical protein